MTLEEIEARWRAASSGPWSRETAEEVKRNEPPVPREQQVRTYEDALRVGLCSNPEEYIRMREELAWAPLTEDEIRGELDSITACPPALLKTLDRLENEAIREWLGSPELAERSRAIQAGADPEDPTLPQPGGPKAPGTTFWVSKSARPQDVEFALHAPKDVGDLLTEVARLRQLVRDLGGDPG